MFIKFASRLVFWVFVVCTVMSSLVAAEQEPLTSDLLSACGQAAVGAEAPWLSGWTLDEHVFNIAKPFDDESVQRVALVFWASWCQPCLSGLHRLGLVKDELDKAGVVVVLVNVGEQVNEVADFVEGQAVPFQIVLDPYGNCRETFLRRPDGRELLPLTVLIDRNSVVLQIIGAEREDYEDLLLEREPGE